MVGERERTRKTRKRERKWVKVVNEAGTRAAAAASSSKISSIPFKISSKPVLEHSITNTTAAKF